LLAENFGNFWENVVLLKILRTYENITDNIVRKNFCFPEWKGAQILEYPPPPQPETGWHGLGFDYFDPEFECFKPNGGP
jgi:hypothetical protein